MTVLTKIQIAEISQYLASAANANGGLFGGQPNPLLPIQLYIERKAVQYRYNYEGIASAIQASATITVDSLEGAGTIYSFTFSDADLGVINLGVYVEAITDTDTTILAASLTTALNENLYGYAFTSSDNVIRCIAPARLGANANGILLVCTITVLVVELETISTPDVSAAPSSADSIMYILKVTNNLATTQVIQEVKSYVRGTHVAGDFFSADVYYNTSPILSGSTYLNSAAPIDSNTTQYNIAVSQAISAAAIGYIILVLSVNSSPVAGRTGFIDGSIDPVELTIQDNPPQENNQSALSGVVTIS